MKNKNDLLQRAIILTCLSDRCAQERSVIGGISRSLAERKQQRTAICNWLDRMGYLEKCTETEKAAFHKEVEKKSDLEVLQMQINYECIEPILWTTGLLDKLSNYNGFRVNRKLIEELNDAQLSKLTQIAERRFYSFEWMAGEDNWDEVELVC
ncbi:protein of unknown function [Butyrivibrio sp. INlla14]|nr:protein of unknown function [Butyrivibrio sp. INlla14]